jgi:hypothetical protein
MIVNKREKGWEIIQQPAHALAAMEICTQLDLSSFNKSEVSAIMAAIALHDDQESFYENGSYLSDEGTPLDFTFLPMDAGQRTEQARRIVKAGFLKSALVGSLIIEHYLHLYIGQDIEEKMRKALEEGLKKKDKFINNGVVSAECVKRCYSVMGFCDRLSLTLCKDDTPAMGRKLEIGKLSFLDDLIYLKVEDGKSVLEPWPFQNESFTLPIEAFYTDQLTFKSDGALEKILTGSLPEQKIYHFRREQ